MDVAGKVVVVTGAGAGIGAALARETAARGASAVAVVDVDFERAASVSKELSGGPTKVQPFACDVSSHEGVTQLAEAVVDAFGPVGLVCSNAGVSGASGPLIDMSPGDVEWVVSVNLRGVWNCCSVFGRLLANGDGGWLLNTASEHALGVPHLGGGIYTATKHAVLGLSDVLRQELPGTVGVSVLCPGLVSTQLWNVGRLRPRHLGGPIPSAARSAEIMGRGMDPALVAKLAVDGVAEEAFLIATHPHALAYAQKRWDDVRGAFEHLDSLDLGIPSYDVTEIVGRPQSG